MSGGPPWSLKRAFARSRLLKEFREVQFEIKTGEFDIRMGKNSGNINSGNYINSGNINSSTNTTNNTRSSTNKTSLHVFLRNGDVFEWHILISPQQGNYQGLRLHARMYFTDDFPSSPPRIELDTNIPHSNTFGAIGHNAYICLDLLSRWSSKKYAGWTPAYSVGALLRQLQSFLFDAWVGYRGVHIDVMSESI